MADPVQVIIAITGLIVAIFVFLKSIKTVQTPCFRITVNGQEQDATILSYLTHRFTPRTVQQTANVVREVAKDVATNRLGDVEMVADEATQSKK